MINVEPYALLLDSRIIEERLATILRTLRRFKHIVPLDFPYGHVQMVRKDEGQPIVVDENELARRKLVRRSLEQKMSRKEARVSVQEMNL